MNPQPEASDVVIALATAALLVACAMAMLLQVAIAIAWMCCHRRDGVEDRAEARWGRIFTRAGVGVDLVARWKVRRREAPVVLEKWIRRRDSVTDGRTLDAVARHVGLHAHAHRLARRRRGRAHMAGVVALGWLGQRHDVELLERIVRRGREPMASVALASLVRLDAPPAFPIIRRWLQRGTQPLPAVVGAALLQAPKGALATLVRHEAKTHANQMPGLLRIIGLRRDAEGLMAVRGVLVDPQAPAEALAAALHALAEIGRPSDVVYASRLLSHPNWAVRVRAVHAVARLGGRASTYRLARLLDDPDPWVRRRAAEAVVADPTAAVDTGALSERARLAFEEALTRREVAA
ncbi:MAG: hypothetical protein QOG30_2908 [Acidimicrobiaceae bacterium]